MRMWTSTPVDSTAVRPLPSPGTCSVLGKCDVWLGPFLFQLHLGDQWGFRSGG